MRSLAPSWIEGVGRPISWGFSSRMRQSSASRSSVDVNIFWRVVVLSPPPPSLLHKVVETGFFPSSGNRPEGSYSSGLLPCFRFLQLRQFFRLTQQIKNEGVWKFTLEQAMKAQLYSSFYLGARWKLVNATPRPLYPRERSGTHCIGGWVGPRAGLDGCGKSRPTGIRSPDRPARIESLYGLRYPKCRGWGLGIWIVHVTNTTTPSTGEAMFPIRFYYTMKTGTWYGWHDCVDCEKGIVEMMSKT